MVQAHVSAADQELGDVIDMMLPVLSDEPTAPVEAFTIAQLKQFAFDKKFHAVADSFEGPKASGMIPRRLAEHDFEAVVNRATKDGRWKVGGRNADIYARRTLTMQQRLAAAETVRDRARKKA